jgi:Spy/CpxP family protein refolding chaperone
MKTNKLGLLTAITLGGLLALTLPAMAQEKKEEKKDEKKAPAATGKASPQDRLKQIAEDLKLTDEQKEKVRPIFQEQFEKMRVIFTDANVPAEEKRTKIQELRTTYNGKIKALLTPEQAEKWDKMQEQQAGKAKKKQ